MVGGDVRKKGEGAATEDPVRALTLVRAEAGEQDHARGQVGVCEGCVRFGGVRCGAFVTAIGVPEICRRAESLPFAVVRGRDGVADVAAKGHAVGVVRRALFAAVEFRNW